MSADELELWLAALAASGGRPQRRGHYWKAQCPSHQDRHASLSLTPMPDGGVRVKCFAGCAVPDIMDRLGLRDPQGRRRAAAGAASRPKPPPAPPPDQLPDPVPLPSEKAWQRFPYYDAAGDIFAVVLRRDLKSGKDIRQMTPHPSGDGWMWRGPKGLWPLYGLGDVLAQPDARITIVEGEKCVHAARAALGGALWITWAGGTDAWHKTDWTPLAGRTVTIIPDNDPPGLEVMDKIANRLCDIGAEQVWEVFPERAGAPQGSDIADWIDAGADLKRIAATRRLRNPDDSDAADIAAAEAEAEANAEAVVSEAERAAHEILARNEHFIVLGTDHGRIVIQNSGEIETYGRASLCTVNTLIGLAPLLWWQQVTGEGVTTTQQARNVGNELLRYAERRGTIDPHHYTGRGATTVSGGRHDGKVAWHLGDRVLIEGSEIAFDDETLDGSRTVWISEARIDSHPSPAADVRRAIADAVMSYRWKTPDDGRRLLGWIVAALAGGVLGWRPQILLHAPPETGKSWLLKNVVRPFLCGDGMHEPIADASAAYISRVTGHTALPIVVDEAEPDQPWVIELLDLMRISAGGEGVRGRADASGGGVITQRPRFCAMLAATRVPILSRADASRISLVRLGGEVESWSAVEAAITGSLTRQTAHQTRSSIIRDTAAIAAAAREVSVELQAEGWGSREADIRGALTAGWQWWGADDVVVMANTAADHHDDAENALLELLALTKRVDGGAELSVLAMLRSTWRSNARAASDLFGMRRDDDALLLLPNHKGLLNELSRTRSRLAGTELSPLLGQVAGCERPPNPLTVGHQKGRCIRFGPEVLDRLGIEFTIIETGQAQDDGQQQMGDDNEF